MSLEFDADGFVDMRGFDATDPDEAVPPPVLSALHHALVSGHVPDLPAERWAELVARAVAAGRHDAPSISGHDLADAYHLDVDHLVPTPAAPTEPSPAHTEHHAGDHHSETDHHAGWQPEHPAHDPAIDHSPHTPEHHDPHDPHHGH